MVQNIYLQNASVNDKVFFRDGDELDVGLVIRIGTALFIKNLFGERIPFCDIEIIRIIRAFDFLEEIKAKKVLTTKTHSFVVERKLLLKKNFLECNGQKCKTIMSRAAYSKRMGICPSCTNQ